MHATASQSLARARDRHPSTPPQGEALAAAVSPVKPLLAYPGGLPAGRKKEGTASRRRYYSTQCTDTSTTNRGPPPHIVQEEVLTAHSVTDTPQQTGAHHPVLVQEEVLKNTVH
jgi:hypothetical protein